MWSSRLRACILIAAAGTLSALGPLLARPASGHGDQGADGTIEEIVVIGRRPVTATSTVTAEDFELRPLESGGQMLEAVPGVLTAQHTGGGKAEQYFLRGFDADHGTDLLVYFDGVPINLRSHAHGQGYLDLHFVTRETIDRLDVSKGPYSTRFGDFATAATIEYVPFARLDESIAKFELGEWATYRSVGVISPRFGPFGESDREANTVVSFEAYHTDGPFDNDEDLWRYSAFARGEVDLSPELTLSGHLLGYYADWNASGLVPRRIVNSGGLNRFGSLDPSEGGDTTRVQGKLQIDWEPADNAHLSANVYLAYYNLDLYSNFTYGRVDPSAGDGIVQRDDRLYAGGRVEYEQGLHIPWHGDLRAGLEWRIDDAQVRLGRQTRRQVSRFDSEDHVTQLSLGPYVEVEVLPLDWIRFIGGVRLEYLDYDVESRLPAGSNGSGDDYVWLPKANLVLSPFSASSPWSSEVSALRQLEIFLNFGIGFHSNDARAGLDDENLLARAPGAEIGLRTLLFDRVSFSVGGFWLELEDELVFAGDAGTTERGGRSRRFGVELAMSADLTDWLYARGDIAYTSARFTSGDDPIPQAPRFIGKGAVGVHFGGFAAELGVRSLDDRYASEAFRSPKLTGYTILDLGARYRFGPFELGLAVENLGDVKWRSSEFFYASCAPSEVGTEAACPAAGGGQGIGDFHFSPGNPRNVRGWVRYGF